MLRAYRPGGQWSDRPSHHHGPVVRSPRSLRTARGRPRFRGGRFGAIGGMGGKQGEGTRWSTATGRTRTPGGTTCRGSSRSTTTWSSRPRSGRTGCRPATGRSGPGSSATPARRSWTPPGRSTRYTKGGDGPVTDWWVYEDLAQPIPMVVASAGYPPEEYTPGPDRLRRDAAGLLRPDSPTGGHGRQPDRALAVLPDDHPLRRPDVLRGQGQGPRPPLRAGLQRLDDRRMVRRRPAAGSFRSCIIPLWDARLAAARRSGATPPGAVGRSRSPRCRATSACPRSTTRAGYWDPVFAACDETGHGALHAHRLGFQAGRGQPVRAAAGRRDADVHQRPTVDGGVAPFRAARPVPAT